MKPGTAPTKESSAAGNLRS